MKSLCFTYFCSVVQCDDKGFVKSVKRVTADGCRRCQSCFWLSDLSLGINASSTTWQQFWGWWCFFPQGSVVVLRQQSLEPDFRMETFWSATNVTNVIILIKEQLYHHKPFLRHNERHFCFSYYGFGPFAGRPVHHQFHNDLDKRPWWKHSESYYLALMNFWQWQFDSWSLIPRPMFSSCSGPLLPECFWYLMQSGCVLMQHLFIAELTMWLPLCRKTGWVLSSVNKFFGLCLSMRPATVVVCPLSHSGVGFLPVWELGGVLTGQSLS